jgi:hypothetical protein
MLAHIRNRIPRRTKPHCVIRCSARRVAVESNIVFLAEIKKFVFMPIRMKFNLLKENSNEEKISSNVHT